MSDAGNKTILQLRNLRKSYPSIDGDPLEVIRLRQFDLGASEQIVLVGQSGSGKSTLLNLIAGILLPDEGEILVNGTNPTQLSEAARDRFRAANIGYVFQSFNLLQGFTALENVLLGQMFGSGNGGTDRAAQLLNNVGLGHRLHHKPRALSVGEQQRVAIARALVNAPPLVLADEPTGSLDSKNGAAVLELLRRICAEGNHALLLVTHDPQVMSSFEKVVRLEDLQ
ncbi:MAG TPA: ABC transporter ATP-binding protein [Verrucomicrobiae bacterium]|nr:ABC transporter ATP-binding protein [Verrucomicrobiae bacterium]